MSLPAFYKNINDGMSQGDSGGVRKSRSILYKNQTGVMSRVATAGDVAECDTGDIDFFGEI